MTGRRSSVERNLDAEVRGIEEGHRALLVDGKIRVVSDSEPTRYYEVGAIALGGPVVFTCQPRRKGTDEPVEDEDSHRVVSSTVAGIVPCKHAAVAARRLEREGLVDWIDGRWITSVEKVDALAVEHAVDDPFAGFPKI